MADIRQVAVSGAVGKQVFASTEQSIVEHLILDAPTSAATVEVREANASGLMKMSLSVPAGQTKDVPMGDHRFDTGMHVEVIGLNAKAYLVVK